MADPVGALRVDLSANIAQFEKDMKRARWAVGSASTKMGKSINSFRGHVAHATKGIFSLKSAIAGLGVGVLIRDVVRTSAEFQKLQASLLTVTGSAEAADAAFAMIKEFASTTPFSLQQVTQGFIKLKALGLDPSADALRSYGNTASAMGKSLNQMVEAIADAATGEFERLKEFGIRASSEGDRVRFTFQGVTTDVGKNAAEIEQYLRRLGELQFAGAMEREAATLGGALSNLGDAVSVFQNEVGEGGLASAIADIAREMSDTTNKSHTLARGIGSTLGDAVRLAADGVRLLMENIRLVTAAVAAFAAYKLALMFGSIAASVGILTVQLGRAAFAMGTLNAAMRANPIGLVATAISAIVAALILFNDKTVTIGDTTTRVGDVLNAVWTTVSQTLIGLIKSVTLLGTAFVHLVNLDFTRFGATIGAQGEAISQSVDKIAASWSKVGAEAPTVETAVESVAVATSEMTEQTTQAVDKLADLRSELRFELDQLGRNKVEQQIYNLAKKEGVEVNRQFREEIGPMVQALVDAKDATEAAKNAEQARQRMMDQGRAVTESMRTEQEVYNDRLWELNDLLNQGAISQDTFARAAAEAKETLDDASKSTDKNIDLARDLGMTFTSAFEDAVVSGGKFSDILKGLEQDLMRLFMRQMVMQPLMNAAGGLFSGLFGGLFGGGGGASASVISDGAMLSGPVPGFAAGGSHRGGLRLVGERGPELESTGPARYYSNDQTRALLSGGGGNEGVTVNVYAPPGSSVEQRESTEPGGRSIDVIIDEAVARNVTTPGSRTGRAIRNTFAGVSPTLAGR